MPDEILCPNGSAFGLYLVKIAGRLPRSSGNPSHRRQFRKPLSPDRGRQRIGKAPSRKIVSLHPLGPPTTQRISVGPAFLKSICSVGEPPSTLAVRVVDSVRDRFLISLIRGASTARVRSP